MDSSMIKINDCMSCNINVIKRVTTVDMRRFYVIIDSGRGYVERYEISKDKFFSLRKQGIPYGKKKNKKK